MKTSLLRWITIAVFSLCLFVGLCCSRNAPPQLGGGDKKPEPTQTTSTPATDNITASRKIIRNGSVTLGCEDPTAAERQAAELTREVGGYVASSRSALADEEPLDEARQRVTLTLRVPSSTFDTTMDRLKAIGHVLEEKTTTQDISDEYVDLDARLRAQRALEAQLLDLLKQAKTVKDVLEVHAQAASVQAEIEKIEGRQKLLDSQLSLSTIDLEITHKTSSARRWQVSGAIAKAGADFVNVSGMIIVYGIRLLGVLLPILLIVGLPVFAFVRLLIAIQKRRGRTRPGRA